MDETITIKLHIMQVPKQRSFLNLKPKLFVITLDQAWPSYFLSMLCIYDEEGLLGDNKGISNSMSSLNVMDKEETF